MTPEPQVAQQRSSVELSRNTKGVNPTVKVYAGDEDVDAAVEAAKRAFTSLDDFARKQAE